MRPKTLHVMAACLTAGAGVWCWWLLTMQADGSRAAGKVPVRQQTQTRAVPAVKWPDRKSPEFKRMAGERAQPWLAAHGRDAASLIAMWDLTGDETLLKEAAEKFPNDPRVCVAMISAKCAKASDALPWIERLIAAEPKNPQGYYLKAWALMTGKDREGALAALTQGAGLQACRRNNHARERALTVRDAALNSGMSSANAARVAIDAPFDRLLSCRMGGGINGVITGEITRAKEERDDTRLLEISGLGIAIAKGMAAGGPHTLIEESFANRLEEKVLAGLPDDMEIGVDGRTAGGLKADLKMRAESIQKAVNRTAEVALLLRNASDTVASNYATLVIDCSEEAASAWLLQKSQEAQGKP